MHRFGRSRTADRFVELGPQWSRLRLYVLVSVVFLGLLTPAGAIPDNAQELVVTAASPGRAGGGLVVAQRAELRTLNPLTAVDNPSREVIWRLMAGLIRINRNTQRTESALAASWTASSDGRRYTVTLRRGLRFSDGHACDADDVVFTFQVYLDEALRSPQRDLLVVGGKPITVRKVDSHTIVFELAAPYAAAERLFDGIAILPRHLLEPIYRAGGLAKAWSLATPPGEIAGLGPFRVKEYVAGQRIVLERNPYYWKTDRAGQRLPYLDRLTFLFVSSEDAQVVRFQAGDTDVISRFSADNFAALQPARQAGRLQLVDLGPGLEYEFMFFNLNRLPAGRLPEVAARQEWFRRTEFRQAVSAAIDREAIIRLAYQGRATPLWAHVTPGNRLWENRSIPRPPRSVERARRLLRAAGFTWGADGQLVDQKRAAVTFTIVTNASNAQRVRIATIIQEDLQPIGIRAQVVPLEFRAFLDRVLKTHDYDAAVLGLGGGDADPNAEMNVWLSSGGSHLWHLNQSQPATPWEAEIDDLMRRQLVTLASGERKRLYDRVQALVAEHLPVIGLVSPNILVGAKTGLGNFRPAILDHPTLWNVDELFWHAGHAAHR